MLRSLVGSEMCIRDSADGAGARSADRRGAARHPAAPALRPALPGPRYACLLYTSDAADDPPCVDLGGPRILKKKKNTITIISHDSTHYLLSTYTIASFPSP